MVNIDELERVVTAKYGDRGAAFFFREYVKLFIELEGKDNREYLLRALERDYKEFIGEDHGS